MTANIVELVKMAPNVTNRLVDLLVGVRVGVSGRLPRVNEEIASRPPLEIGAASLEAASTRAMGRSLP